MARAQRVDVLESGELSLGIPPCYIRAKRLEMRVDKSMSGRHLRGREPGDAGGDPVGFNHNHLAPRLGEKQRCCQSHDPGTDDRDVGDDSPAQTAMHRPVRRRHPEREPIGPGSLTKPFQRTHLPIDSGRHGRIGDGR